MAAPSKLPAAVGARPGTAPAPVEPAAPPAVAAPGAGATNDDRVAELVAAAPPLTAEQISRLRALLHPIHTGADRRHRQLKEHR